MGGLRTKIEEMGEPTLRTDAPRFAPAGQSTQMIVGADGASDAISSATSKRPLRQLRAAAGLLFGFSPIPDAPRACRCKRPPLMREHRLYQSDWMMRFYGFGRPSGGAPAERACSRSISIPSSPGRSSFASASRSTSTAPARDAAARAGTRREGGRRRSWPRAESAAYGWRMSGGGSRRFAPSVARLDARAQDLAVLVKPGTDGIVRGVRGARAQSILRSC
jgi:hypothetical protein